MSENGHLEASLIKNIGSMETSWKELSPKNGSMEPLREALLSLEKKIIKNAMKNCRSTRQLAVKLGISQPTIVRKLKKHGLQTKVIHF